MVHLGKIYTRTGDDGTTGLGDGTRVPKHDPRVAAYGAVDETSSAIGVALSQELPTPLGEHLRRVQNDLFDLGADLCVPGTPGDGKLRVTAGYVERLERWIDAANADLAPLGSFILPGGEPGAAWLHLARTVCRRAEREVEALLAGAPDAVNPATLRYLNRLSDLLFVYARVVNDHGQADVLWEPGAGGASSTGSGGEV